MALKKNIERNTYLKKNGGEEREKDEKKIRSEKEKLRMMEIEGVTEKITTKRKRKSDNNMNDKKRMKK